MCELASAVLRRHVGDLPAFEEWQGRSRVAAGSREGGGMGRQVMCEFAVNAAGGRHGNGMVCVNPALVAIISVNFPFRCDPKFVRVSEGACSWTL
jgi:hypothetical protein